MTTKEANKKDISEANDGTEVIVSTDLEKKIQRAKTLNAIERNTPLIRYFDLNEEGTNSYVLGYN